jgi:hypothetical protein
MTALTQPLEARSAARPRRWRPAVAGVSLALVSLALVACSHAASSGSPAAAQPPSSGSAAVTVAAVPAPLRDLSEVGQLEAAFNQDTGKPRLILLVSPT